MGFDTIEINLVFGFFFLFIFFIYVSRIFQQLAQQLIRYKRTVEELISLDQGPSEIIEIALRTHHDQPPIIFQKIFDQKKFSTKKFLQPKTFSTKNFSTKFFFTFSSKILLTKITQGSLHKKKPEKVWCFTKQGGEGYPLTKLFRLFPVFPKGKNFYCFKMIYML